ncbi:acyl-CoA binding protein [Dictyostelium discoideum AX4]|uniref:Acyl-CoA-binding protein n=1 Tax=Dictyostelium discoideum TaxID=44689 RepID=ACBP_DICDI|nr:acyl-CoA binding protein [Dictyostelium discoideum AX4]Q5FXM5.1 RecName: Full=Acyl-CoA-binding protein; Short=ACBP; Contains: RecName: Full=SDF-2 [Dictyostelium discoideum]AAW70088.1 acyl-CoA binding protein [Dictyostelium discoideum]EAL72679.1 acyl-CoA binding protein [Dictyostelium discoideum AX4]|eukprot:XP_646321.1 acyl-CoA binding protein [Dictyostelium discoideum AX4]
MTTFEEAAQKVKEFTKKPSNDELLSLYGLYKQGTDGDCNISEPWAVQVEAKAKYNAWNALKGTSKEDAKAKYVALYEQLATKYA